MRTGLRFNLFQERVYSNLISRNLSDKSINTNVTYAHLLNANPLQKRIYRSITSAIWKQEKAI